MELFYADCIEEEKDLQCAKEPARCRPPEWEWRGEVASADLPAEGYQVNPAIATRQPVWGRLEHGPGDLMTPREQYDRDGYLSPIDALSAAEVTELRAAFDELEAQVGKEKAQIGIAAMEDEIPFIRKFATHPAILDAVCSVAGPDLYLIATHIFCKYPTDELGAAFVAWHQDVTYWGLEPPKAFTAWLAIDDADEQNGAMLIIPGSHQLGILDHGKSDEDGNLLSVNQAIAEDQLSPETAVTITLKAGQISLHHGQVVHGSRPNHSNRRRCGMTIRFTTPDVAWVGDPDQKVPWKPVLVRGEDKYHRLEPAP